MAAHDINYQRACIKAMQPLVGKSIKGLVKDESGNFGFELEDKTLVWILCDPEGNGPGFAEIVPSYQIAKG